MSDTPTAPEGSDPRVLSPDDDEPDVLIAHGYTTGKKYHTNDCSVVSAMDSPKPVSRSLAEWKGYDKCGRCAEIDEDDDAGIDPAAAASIADSLYTAVDPIMCLQIRCLLLGGATQSDVEATLRIGAGTVARHAKGCNCDHSAPPLEYDRETEVWQPAADPTPAESLRGQHIISEQRCFAIRYALQREGVTRATLGTLYDAVPDTISDHANGRCRHTHDTAPERLRYDHGAGEWVAADAPEVRADD